jgi:tRNA(Ile)-lysidine synthase
MSSFAERVDRTILRYSLLPPGARVLVALSGGADSTALACVLVDLSSRRGFSVEAAAHFNHRLRPPASDEDEAFCRDLARQLGLDWVSASADVRAFAAAQGTSVEDAGRRLRYAFLGRAAAERGATHVAVGHTRDDQAETVLLQMLRGAGPRGLRGMVPARPLDAGARGGSEIVGEAGMGGMPAGVLLVRPLIDSSHDELVEWLAGRAQGFREDESNRDLRFLRNRVRHEVVPFLRSRVGPSIVRVLAGNAAIAAEDAELLEALSRESLQRVLSARSGERVELDAAALCREPRAVRGRVVLRALGNLAAGRFVGRAQVERVLALVEGNVRGPVALPGLVASVSGGRLLLVRSTGRKPLPAAGMNFPARALSIPGEAVFGSLTVSSSVRPWDAAVEGGRLRAPGAGASEAIVDASRVGAGLSVRARRPGDWLRPLGLGGRKKKLQDYFVDRKVPRQARDGVPLVVDRRDRIVWVAGHGIDEEFRVIEGTHDVVILRLRGESA